MKLRMYNYVFIGTVIEHLDNILFALFLPVLASFFFSDQGQESKWILAFAAFALYFVVRPVGALIFGVIGDKYGRKIALLGSVLSMSIATLLIGVLPSYESIGISSSVIFLSLRVLQGLSVGGEYGSAMTYIYDNCPANRRTFFGSLLIASTHLGGVIAAGLAAFGSIKFQYIFIGVGVVGILSLKGRMSLVDKYHSDPRVEYDTEFVSHEIKQSFKNYFYVFGLSACLVSVFYTSIVFLSKIGSVSLGMSTKSIALLNALLLSIWFVCSPIVGYIIDYKKISSSKVMRVASMSIVVLAPSILFLFEVIGFSIKMFILFQILISVLHIGFCAPTPKLICGVFSNRLRNTNVALSYALGSSFAAAASPFLNEMIYQRAGIKGVGIMISLFALLGFFTCLIKEKN